MPSEDGGNNNAHLIWLPNSIVMGTPNGEQPPVSRLRGAQDVLALGLFVDLYQSQNLLDDGGISPHVLSESYEQEKNR